ncbi:MAG TPA: ATP-binding protein [Methylophilaceae bacterium]|nr:ATP-binding protein [Methylophilaceae bacterium]
MLNIARRDISHAEASTYWRSIGIFNLYRIIIACIFIGSHFLLPDHTQRDNYDGTLYLEFATGYLLFGLAAIIFTWLRWPQFDRQVTLQVITDVIFIVIIMFAAGGIKSGLGLLLVIAIAAASLISHGRLALFYASVASISLLLEQSYQLISWNEHYDDYSHAVMLCLSCFATAWLAHSFAKRTYLSESLASQRKIDLENLGQINALITQEMQDGVLVVDSEFKLRHHNAQAEELLNLSNKTSSVQLLDEFSPELASLTRQWMTESTATGSNIAKLTSADKELKLRFMPVGDDRKQGAVVFIEDWSQMQAQAQQLKLAALGQLTANIAHEIRNPLSAISHATQLLQEEENQDPSSQRMLQIISDNVQRMDQMVKDVLELNRRDRTKQEAINLNQFLAEFHEQFCQIENISANNFKLNLNSQSAQSHPVQIVFDRRHLHQILWNLCRNGWRHSHQAEASLTLTLRSSTRSRSTYIEIVDDGAGISQEVQAHLFEPFFTTESTGTGLGLYIARELCEANSATIKYTNRNPGSLFTIQIKKSHA